jgi:hypothetical protein
LKQLVQLDVILEEGEVCGLWTIESVNLQRNLIYRMKTIYFGYFPKEVAKQFIIDTDIISKYPTHLSFLFVHIRSTI